MLVDPTHHICSICMDLAVGYILDSHADGLVVPVRRKWAVTMPWKEEG
jgi:hypothetical protein